MKGRTVWNKPSIRKSDVYKLIVKLGGKARWAHLKAHLKELGWGPTTLKRTLDEMVQEGSVVKEAVAGNKGPEIWYKLPKSVTNFLMLFPRTTELISESFLDEPLSLEKVVDTIQKRTEGLEKDEREVFLMDSLRELVERGAQNYKMLLYYGIYELLHKRSGLSTQVNALLDMLKDASLGIMKVFLAFPEVSEKIAVGFLLNAGLVGLSEDTINEFGD